MEWAVEEKDQLVICFECLEEFEDKRVDYSRVGERTLYSTLDFYVKQVQRFKNRVIDVVCFECR